MRIGTAEKGSTFLSQGIALKRVLEGRVGTGSIEVLESQSASIENALRLDDGDIQFGFMAFNWIGRAHSGNAPFRRPIQLRMAAPMNSGPMYFIAKAESSIRVPQDLRGKKVAVGPKQSGICQHAISILGALGINFTDFIPVYLDLGHGAQALKQGEIDAQLQCPIPNSVMSELDATTELRVLPVSDDELSRVLAAFPVYRKVTMEKGKLRALTANSVQPGVLNVLVTHERVPETMVESATKAIIEGAHELALHEPLFNGLNELLDLMRGGNESTFVFDGVPLHEGAMKVYREAGFFSAG
jgi:TRAP transporter TAXI family solute receptor